MGRLRRDDGMAVTRFGRLWRELLVATAFLVMAGTSHAQAPPLARMVISPPGDEIRQLFLHPDDWRDARAMTGALLYADHNLSHFSDDELRAWFATMRGWGIRLELEVGAVKPWGHTAEATFKAEQPLWDRVIRLGGDLGSVAMDEPLDATRSRLHESDAYAVEQTARFVELARQRYPGLKIGDIEPYPSIPLADHVAWVRQVQQRLRADGAAPLDFYRLDVNWIAFTKTQRGDWREVATLAAATRAAGVPFSLIYWASGYPSEKAAGMAGDDTWYVEVLGQGYAAAGAGIRPDQFVLESWITTPPRTVPDNGEFTFTRSVLDFGRKFGGFTPGTRNLAR